MGRSSRCAECATPVVVTSARPQFRGGAMVLICQQCSGDTPAEPAAAETEVDYDELYVSIEEDADDAYDDVQVLVGEVPEYEPEAPAPTSDGNVFYGTDDAAVSGAVDINKSDSKRREPTLPPVVIE